MSECTHNAALAAYISYWQNFTSTLPKSGSDASVVKLAHQDLCSALQNYRNWQNRPKAYIPEYPILWQSDVAKLHDCGGNGSTLLVIPSLINSHQIVDLCPDASLIDHLRTNEFHVHLLKWNGVEAQCPHGSNDYVRAIRQAGEALSQDFQAIGYCVGGTLLNIAAIELPNLKKKILLGAPWKFHHDQGQIGAWAQSLRQHQSLDMFFEQSSALYGLMPSTMIDYFFAGLNPLQFVQKFRNAHNPDPIFDALENWLTSGLDLSLPFSKELVMDWMRDDTLSKSSHHHETPTLVVHGARDHIAPPASCLGILKTLGQYDVIKHPSGHVGLMIGQKARQHLWPQIVNYLQNDSR